MYCVIFLSYTLLNLFFALSATLVLIQTVTVILAFVWFMKRVVAFRAFMLLHIPVVNRSLANFSMNVPFYLYNSFFLIIKIWLEENVQSAVTCI